MRFDRKNMSVTEKLGIGSQNDDTVESTIAVHAGLG